MPAIKQNDWERIKDQVDRGLMTVEQSHVEKVRCQRVLLVAGKLPATVRAALNAAVKVGQLGRMPKAGNKPEAYFHPTFDYLAVAERNAHERHVLRSLVATCG